MGSAIVCAQSLWLVQGLVLCVWVLVVQAHSTAPWPRGDDARGAGGRVVLWFFFFSFVAFTLFDFGLSRSLSFYLPLFCQLYEKNIFEITHSI